MGTWGIIYRLSVEVEEESSTIAAEWAG